MASGMESIVNRSEAFSLTHTSINERMATSLPVTLLFGEDVRYSDKPNAQLVITNYRIVAQLSLTAKPHYYDIPIGAVEQVELLSGSCELIVCCKSGQLCRLTHDDPVKCEEWQQQLIKAIKAPSDITNLFAFKHSAYCKDKNSHHPHDNVEWMCKEFERMRMKSNGWKLTDTNSQYKLCSTYPKLLVVPQYYQDEQLSKVAKFRKSGRVPAVVWRDQNSGCVIARSSQPQVGVWNWREREDEKLLEDILRTCTSKNCKQLLILDLRHYTAALANKAARGGGYEYEDYYQCCEVQFKGLPNIHAVQKSFVSLRSLIAEVDSNSFFSMLEQSHWLEYISQLLQVTNQVVEAVAVHTRPVLVHCSDGWDRTSQVVSLAELLLDPYYRTIEGFQVLIEKEWLAYGHKFADRCGQSNCSSSELSPVFLQWVECIIHVTRQFPTAFQFNESFLVTLVMHTYSNKYGTLLGNCPKEREVAKSYENTESLWGLLSVNNKTYINFLYKPLDKAIIPNDHVVCFRVWSELYSCLIHDYPDDYGSICVSDNVDACNDEIDNRPLLQHIQYSQPSITMDTIQQRLQDLLAPPDNLSMDSLKFLTNQETESDAHNSLESDKVDTKHEWEMVTEEDATRTRWVPDHAAYNCHYCNIKFTLYYRRHHCRNCGNVFCASCSNYFCPIPHELLTDHRVCRKCYERLYDPSNQAKIT